jgi:two-component system, NtrC family, sensor kinase
MPLSYRSAEPNRVMKVTEPQKTDWRTRVFDSLSFPTLVLDTNRVIVSANRKFLEKTGAGEDEIVGKTCREIVSEYLHDDGLTCSSKTCPLERTIQSGTGHSILRQIRSGGDPPRWEDRVFSPILDDEGRVIYIIESFRDVTKTIQMEQAFYGMRELLDRVILNSVSAIVAADRKGQIMLMNPAAENLFERPFQSEQRINIRELYPEGVAQEIMQQLRGDCCGGRGKLTVTKVSILTSSGEKIPVEMTAAIIYEHGQEMATMGIYNDLRDRIALDNKLKEAEALVLQSEKMASLGRLAAGVAHEINNPLTGILLYGNMMMEKLEDAHPMRTSLNYILEDAGRCKDIVQHLLAYSRQSTTSRELFPTNQLVEESLNLIRDQKLFINVQIRRELAEEPLPLFADRQRLRQVIINLVMNAIDAMNQNGTLTLRTYASQDGRHICLEIADSGSGIPKENLSHIFDPFFTTKEPGKGTGLGLSTAYGIIKDNGGEISVKRTGPEGTTFLITLPLASQSATGMPESIG